MTDDTQARSGKLSNLVQERISGFELQIQSEAAQRKSTEESRITKVNESIAKLEKSLNGEIRRRLDGNKQLTEIFSQQVGEVQSKLEKLFVEKLDMLQSSVEGLNKRASIIETEFVQQKEKYIKEVQEQNVTVARDVTTLQTSFDSEKLSRSDRESQLCRRLGELESKSQAQLEAERNLREQKYSTFHQSLEEAKGARADEDEKFEGFIMKEMDGLKTGLVSETQERERADDDIVQAINHYTKALQDALRLVNAT
eukprot:GHVS01033886.1.p1 GENE.GHVS01033886.1~~GHVS01033886.1.p1  ORF type:complete len:274 (+),score=60.69 GHVS01033886.1:58-822(+)